MIRDVDTNGGPAVSEKDANIPQQQAPAHPSVAGIVLAGSDGWGQGPLEQRFWRPLLPILSRPLVWHILDWLQQGGVPEAQICANGSTNLLRHILGIQGPRGMGLQYYQDVMPRGPAGCVRDAATTMAAETFVVLDGTILPGISLTELLRAHRQSQAVLTVVAAAGNHDNGNADAALEPTGILVIERSVLDDVPHMGYQDIKEALIPKLHKEGKNVAKHIIPAGSVPRVQGWASYLAANMWALQEALHRHTLPEDYVTRNSGYVHQSAQVHRSVRFIGPVLVEERAVIEPDVIIVGPTTIGSDSIVRSGAVATCSVLWSRCDIGAGAVLDHCVLADGARVNAGSLLRKTVCIPTQAAQQQEQELLVADKALLTDDLRGAVPEPAPEVGELPAVCAGATEKRDLNLVTQEVGEAR